MHTLNIIVDVIVIGGLGLFALLMLAAYLLSKVDFR